jgi:(p)ppGpp synthase/HD superfamily hydrolase
MEAATGFVRASALLARALDYARSAHESPGADDTPVDHPVHVANILHGHGYGEEVVAAALLHDVVEDTPEELEDIASRFGQSVARLVSALTEDASIEPYEARKAEHRRRVCAAGAEAAAVFAADKLAKVRELRDAGTRVEPRKLEHYALSLEMLGAAHPQVPFLGQLERELAEYREARAGAGAPTGSAA